MRRRDFISGIAGSAAAWPLAARAQQSALSVVGYLGLQLPDDRLTAAVRRGLSQTGYVEGRNLVIESRWAGGQYERLPSLLADLIGHQVAVIVAAGGPAARAAEAATKAIPIVFAVGVDPVTEGLVASLNRPGGNATGMGGLGREMNAKMLEVLCELAPTTSAIGVLLNSANPYHEIYSQDIKAAARRLGRQIVDLKVKTERDLEATFADLRQHRVDSLLVPGEPLFGRLRGQLVALTTRDRIPAIFSGREYVQAGGLISYGPNLTDNLRQCGIYAGRILRGDKPSDLPVLLPTKFEIVLNLKTAAGLGLDVPTSILLRADEVIE